MKPATGGRRRIIHLLIDRGGFITACGYGDDESQVTTDPLAVTCRGECAGVALDLLRKAAGR